MAKLAFLGLGVMGAPMAGHLKLAGHDVTVFNRTAAKAEAWVARHGGALAETPRQAAQDADFVLACVGNDDDLRHVCLGPDAAFAGMRPGAIFVDHTTVSAAVTRELAGAAQAMDLGYVDAPVSSAVDRQMPRSLRIQSTAKPKSNRPSAIAAWRFCICQLPAAPWLITSTTFSTSSPDFLAKASDSDSAWTSPAMAIWLHILVIWPAPTSPMRRQIRA